MNDIIGPVFTKVDTLGASVVQAIYNQLATNLQPVFLLGMTIYIVYWGYEMLFGRASLTAGAFLWRIGRLMVIYMFAFSWGDFQVLFANVLTKAPDSVGNIICQAVGGGSSCSSDGSSISAGLSDVWTAANEAAGKISASGGFMGVAMAVLSYIVLIVAGIFVAIAMALIMLGKIALFVLLGLAPIFICLALFKISLPIFDGWIRACSQYAIIPLIVYGLLGFYLVLLKTTLTDLQNSAGNLSTALTTVTPFLLMCAVGIYLNKQCLAIAQGIAGGPRMTAGGADNDARRLVNSGGRALLSLAKRGWKSIGNRSSGTGRIEGPGSAQQAEIAAALNNTRL